MPISKYKILSLKIAIPKNKILSLKIRTYYKKLAKNFIFTLRLLSIFLSIKRFSQILLFHAKSHILYLNKKYK